MEPPPDYRLSRLALALKNPFTISRARARQGETAKKAECTHGT